MFDQVVEPSWQLCRWHVPVDRGHGFALHQNDLYVSGPTMVFVRSNCTQVPHPQSSRSGSSSPAQRHVAMPPQLTDRKYIRPTKWHAAALRVSPMPLVLFLLLRLLSLLQVC